MRLMQVGRAKGIAHKRSYIFYSWRGGTIVLLDLPAQPLHSPPLASLEYNANRIKTELVPGSRRTLERLSPLAAMAEREEIWA